MDSDKDNTLRLFVEKYENEKTGQVVEGITIMIDGQLKQVLDAIIKKEGRVNSYPEMIRDIIFAGISNYIGKDINVVD